MKKLKNFCFFLKDRQTFRRIILRAAYEKRRAHEILIDSVPILETLTEYEKMTLADALICKSYDSGECIFGQGETADGMFLIEEGKVQIVQKNSQGNSKQLSVLSKGQYFGGKETFFILEVKIFSNFQNWLWWNINLDRRPFLRWNRQKLHVSFDFFFEI